MKNRPGSKPVSFRLRPNDQDKLRAVAWDLDLDLGQAVTFLAQAYLDYATETGGGADMVTAYKNFRRAKERRRLTVESEFRIKKA